ncbi:hypothetical protein H7U32_07245 [Bifidobacterium pullorum subsp. saeculare]|uniref:DUF8094 domain-containing protein n=1 Tax=Bifidobacterium pullorum subsp. saeculare TaxID=78257 RepID=A0A938WYU1_9BIFI|nr:hypothetical protein [Bifidobacterium pullorum]MBM6700095.1 hypothetical protein [Bifidobacterium pullorum subsp. saeculare]
MTARRITKLAAGALAAALCAGLAGCEGRLPAVTAADGDQAAAAPDLTAAQERKLRGQILDVIKQADDAKDASGLAARLTGPSLAVRTSQIAVAQKTGQMDNKATIPDKIAQTVIPTDSGWPRTVFTITTTTDDQQSNRLLVLTQDSARENYKLWGLARLFQGAQLPNFAVPSIGSPMGTPKDAGLVATPEQAVERYADVLAKGDQSEFAADFADDDLRRTLAEQSAKVQQAMEANAGTQEQTFQVAPGQLKVMRSADGSDLVVAEIDSVWTRAAGEGRESLPASDAETALFGGGQATSTMKVTYVNIIALVVPPKDSGLKITAVGAERQPVKVEAV